MTPEDAREFFRSCDRARKTLERLRCRLEALRSPTFGSGDMVPVMGGGHSDPTQDAANAIVETERGMAEAERRLNERIELCGRVCDGVGAVLGYEVGFALRDHYVGGMTLDSVAASLGVAKSTLTLMFSEAFDYVATVGVSVAARGRGMAETGVSDRFGEA